MQKKNYILLGDHVNVWPLNWMRKRVITGHSKNFGNTLNFPFFVSRDPLRASKKNKKYNKFFKPRFIPISLLDTIIRKFLD